MPPKKLFLSFVNLFVLVSLPLIGSVSASSKLWRQTYLGGAVLGLPSLIQTAEGGFALSGCIGSFDTEDWDFWLIKTDSQGIPEFSSGADILLSLAAFTVALAICKQKMHKVKEVRV